MMYQKLSVPNSIVFAFDVKCGDVVIPEYRTGQLIAFSTNCISVGTLAEMDGETTVHLMRQSETSDFDSVNFEWSKPMMIATPSKSLSVVTSENTVLFTMPVQHAASKIIVGTNSEVVPDVIVFAEALWLIEVKQISTSLTVSLIELSNRELLILNNALNEICNGIGTPEFETRIGATEAEASELLKAIGCVIDSARNHVQI